MKIILFLLLLVFLAGCAVTSTEKSLFSKVKKEQIEAASSSEEGTLIFLHDASPARKNMMKKFYEKVKIDSHVKDVVYAADNEIYITFRREFIEKHRDKDNYLVFLMLLIGGNICSDFRIIFELPSAKVLMWAEKVGVGPRFPATC